MTQNQSENVQNILQKNVQIIENLTTEIGNLKKLLIESNNNGLIKL